VSKNQGYIVLFDDGSRVVFRLSGTGSQGATVRMYIERYSKDPSQYKNETAVGLQPLIDAALEFTKLKEFLGRDKPTVITVSFIAFLDGRALIIKTDYSKCNEMPLLLLRCEIVNKCNIASMITRCTLRRCRVYARL
jgi:hypothetical protein